MNKLGYSFKHMVEIALARKGWTKARLAKEMDITPQYLQDILGEKRGSEFRKNQVLEILKDVWGE